MFSDTEDAGTQGLSSSDEEDVTSLPLKTVI